MTSGATPENTIAFQGEPGANSHIAAQEACPDMVSLPCDTLEDVFAAVNEGLAGRVADVHHLIPGAGLYIVGEHFLRVHHQLLGLKGAKLEGLKTVHSHIHALGQCRRVIRELGLKAVVAADTAGAARQIAESGDPARAALASSLAAEIYSLDVLRANVEDAEHNTTRFLIMAKDPNDAEPEDEPVITSFIFRVRNVPAALYQAPMASI